MRAAYTRVRNAPRPRLEHQGSDSLLKRQFRFIAKGEIGYIQFKHIIGALPEEGERPIKTNKRITVDGWEKEEEEETRPQPTTRRQLERMHTVFRTTLLVITAALPTLDEWYEWFYSCTQYETPGGASKTWSMAAQPSRRLSPMYDKTSSSGNVKSTNECTDPPRGSTHPEKEKENPLTDQSNLSGTSRKRAT